MANNALWLEGWTVHVLDRSGEKTVAEATYDQEMTSCPKCGSVRPPYRHGPHVVKYKDIPTFGKPLTIKATVQRYQCRDCNATFLQQLPDVDDARRMTRRLVEYVLEQGVDQSYSAVARHVAVDEKTVRQMCLANVEATVERNLTEAPIILGIDEVHLAKAKRTVFVDVAGKRLLDMIETMSKAAVTQWLSWMPQRERVRIVTIDMWGPYREVAEALLPNAIIIVDRFHVVKRVEEALRDVRTRVRKGAKGKARKNPRRGRILLHKRPEKLSPMRRMMLQALLDNEPLLKDGWETKEAFHAIWTATDRATAEKAFDDWRAAIPASVAAEFGAAAATVENWRPYVFNFFDHRFTNAYTESLNRITKDFNRVGRGYKFDRIRAKILLRKPITSKPLLLCENCLGVFPEPMILERHLRPMTASKRATNTMMLCPSCHVRIHTAERLSHATVSTEKSE